MEKVNIKVCVRPYYHDVIEEITRKPKFNKTNNHHFIKYKGEDFILHTHGGEYNIWVDED